MHKRFCLASSLAVTCLALLSCAACSDDPNDTAGHSHEGDGEHEHAHAGAQSPVLEDAGVAPPDGSVAAGFVWQLPDGFPRPRVPEDNPMTPEKVALGRHLFYDKRLSENQTFACANCHKQELAFTDGLAVGLGSTGEAHTRGSMSLANVGYTQSLTWANPLMTALERQAGVPMFGDMPIELGLKSIPET
ncbi:MAG: hypothetical protein RL701_6096 [Pseudomonadota bacterium]